MSFYGDAPHPGTPGGRRGFSGPPGFSGGRGGFSGPPRFSEGAPGGPPGGPGNFPGPHMDRVGGIPTQGCAGLERLMGVDEFYIKQHLDVTELVTGAETNNSYTVLDRYGFKVNLVS